MAKVFFSIGGKYFNKAEPIIYEYIEDRIFENARNISIKLHHSVGQFVKLQLFFASKWILISEVSFDSLVTHGNFSTELNPSTAAPEIPVTKQETTNHKIEIPVTNDVASETDIAVIILIGKRSYSSPFLTLATSGCI